MNDGRTIFRVIKDKENPYVMINKQFLKDKRLSWKAKGILTYLLSMPDDWKIYENELVAHSKDGLTSLKSGIKELIELGYISRNQLRNEKGQFKGYEYCVYEVPAEIRFSNNGDANISEPHTTNNNNTNNDLTDKKQLNKAENFEECTDTETKQGYLNDTHTDDSNICDFQEEATILLNKMPNKEGFHRFHLAYKDKRRLHSQEELFRAVDRYLEISELLGRDMYCGCANFFSNGYYIDYLDINYKFTLDNAEKQLKNRKFKNKHSVGESKNLGKWGEQLGEVFGK